MPAHACPEVPTAKTPECPPSPPSLNQSSLATLTAVVFGLDTQQKLNTTALMSGVNHDGLINQKLNCCHHSSFLPIRTSSLFICRRVLPKQSRAECRHVACTTTVRSRCGYLCIYTKTYISKYISIHRYTAELSL